MDDHTQAPLTNDHAFPMEFVLIPAFVGALVWLVTMLSHFHP